MLLHLGQAATVAVVQQKTPPDTRRVLAQVTLCATVRVCLRLTICSLSQLTYIGTADRDAGHEPLLVVEHRREEAQCGINHSPSLLLEHDQLAQAECARHHLPHLDDLATAANRQKPPPPLNPLAKQPQTPETKVQQIA